ncbi:MAG TPA: hypothetical protein PLJ47_11565 [Candidatus Hydrogenedentes bacterium]|nr:hypothetical protein [Candidatus Hydrogenedentota bacterium]HRK35222.1 hypothetical protein [Candidatus Hydrogenedentota bacterium]
MMGSIWMNGMFDRGEPLPGVRDPSKGDDLRMKVRDLEHEMGRLKLLNQALWELLRDKVKVTDAELEARIRELDLRDGVADGRMTEVALKCPTCERVSSSKHWKCLYCGQEFEKPVMG